MRKFKVGAVVLALGAGLFFSLETAKLLAHQPQTPALLPLPQKIQTQQGYFSIESSTGLEIDRTSEVAGQLLAERLRTASGFDLPIIRQARPNGLPGIISLTTESAKPALGP